MTRACTRSCATLTPATSGTSWWTTSSARTPLVCRAHSRAPSSHALTPHAARAFVPDAVIADLRLVAVEWCPCCRDDFNALLCQRYKTRGGWLQGLTPLDSLELNSCAAACAAHRRRAHCSCRYPHGTCFRNVLLGHSSALSVAYFHPSRAMVAREFRDSFFLNLGLSDIIKGSRQINWRQRVTLPAAAARAPCAYTPSLPPPTCYNSRRSCCTRKLRG
jgi:hypothetical protein